MALLTPDFLQSKTYAAKRLRQALSHLGQTQEGVWGANDFKVVQRAAGANMSVDVGSGFALINADDASNRGIYHAENDATVNVSPFTASHATLPRLDKVILQINDSTDGGDLNDTPALSILTGTATSGTTLDNGNDGAHGAPAVPTGALLLSDVLIPAASSSVVTANIRDRRSWARGYFSRSLGTGAGSYTTTSTTAVDIDSTNLGPRVECTGNPFRLTFACRIISTINTNVTDVMFLLDGAQFPDPIPPMNQQVGVTGASVSAFAIALVIPAAGSHVIKVQWLTNTAATLTMANATATERPQLIIEELVRQNAVNG